MSHEIQHVPVGKAPASARVMDQEFKLPSECNVPGYWDTLASNTEDWAPMITAGPFWRNANTQLESWKKEYRRLFNGILYKGPELPTFVGKSAGRIKEKVFQRIRQSEDADREIKRIFDQTTPVPRLEDLVRVRIETQFLDGVPFLANKVLGLAKSFDSAAKIEPKGKLSGYFAQHVTFSLPLHFRYNSINSSCEITCEVQVATSLATLVWENSHGLYESSRVNRESSEDWQWSPNDPRFLSRQLGHMIHLADGLFCNLRDKGSR